MLLMLGCVVGFAVSIAIFYKLNSIHDDDTSKKGNVGLAAAICFFFFNLICLYIVILEVFTVGLQHVLEK